MSQPLSEPPPPSPPVPPGQQPPRRSAPKWGIVVFLLLLAGLVVVNQLAATSGPKIQWIENDLDAALRQVSKSKPRVFLYLYEPNDPTHERNRREVFSRHWAREPLAGAVCCRIALLKDDPNSLRLAQRFAYKDTPLFLLLDRSGQVTIGARTEGPVTELEFFTFISEPIRRSQKPDEGGGR